VTDSSTGQIWVSHGLLGVLGEGLGPDGAADHDGEDDEDEPTDDRPPAVPGAPARPRGDVSRLASFSTCTGIRRRLLISAAPSTPTQPSISA
jgi:hypothetical protein